MDTPDEWNPTDYAYHLTRRARGLPLWFSLAVHGTEAYRDAVETALTLARQTAELIRESPELELIREPGALRRCSSAARAGTRRTTRPGPSACWPGRSRSSPRPAGRARRVARFAFLHPHTTLGIVEEILETMA